MGVPYVILNEVKDLTKQTSSRFYSVEMYLEASASADSSLRFASFRMTFRHSK